MSRHFSLMQTFSALLVVFLTTSCGNYAVRRGMPVVRENLAEQARQNLGYDARRSYDALYLESVRQRERGRFDAQYDLLTAALEINPQASEALFDLARLELSFGGYSDSAHVRRGDSLLQRAVALEPGNRYYKEMLGELMAERGDLVRAIDIYESLVRDYGGTEPLLTLVGLYEERTDYDGAIRALDRLQTLEGRTEAYSLEKFKIYIQKGDTEHAYAEIEALCAEFPLDLRYRVLLGDLYREYGQREMALAIYRDVLTMEPENSLAQQSLLSYYRETGADSLYRATVDDVILNPATQHAARINTMYTYITESSQHFPEDSTHIRQLFRTTLQMPQEDRGLAELRVGYSKLLSEPEDSLSAALKRVLEIEPDYGRARLELLQILGRHNDDSAAIALCREGQLYEPTQVVFYYYEGISHYRLDDKKSALDALQRGVPHITSETYPELASDLFCTMGDLLHDLNRNAEAYAAYDSSLVYNPENILCLNNYAYFLSLDARDLDKAADMARRAVQTEPQNSTYLDTYAWVLFVQRHYEQAKIYIDETLKYISPEDNNAGLYEHAGDIYYKCGERAQALEYWKQALELTTDAKRKAVLKKKIRYKKYYAG